LPCCLEHGRAPAVQLFGLDPGFRRSLTKKLQGRGKMIFPDQTVYLGEDLGGLGSGLPRLLRRDQADETRQEEDAAGQQAFRGAQAPSPPSLRLIRGVNL